MVKKPGEKSAVFDNVNALKIQVAALNELLEVQEEVVAEQSAKLEQTLHKLDERVKQLKSTEEVLRESEGRLHTLVEATSELMWEVDQNGVYTNVSKKSRDLLGYEPEEMIGKTPFDFMPPGKRERIAEEFSEIAKARRPFSELENVKMHKNGSRVILLTGGIPVLDANQKFLGYRGFERDITERKRAEERLNRYAADLARANEEVKEFAYIVSHDLRAPLINLKGFAAELRANLKIVEPALEAALPRLSEKERQEATMAFRQDIPEALDFINVSVTNMDEFITALLKLSRLGRREMVSERLNLAEIVETALKGLAHQLEERHVKVTVGPLPGITGDRVAIEQVVGNILSNAVKYLEPGRPGELEITGERNEEETTISIRDNGRGIAKEDTAKVFMPFRRLGRPDVKGEGMGMTFAQTLAHRHGGYIFCESELGVGTKFVVHLSNHPEQGVKNGHGKTD